MILERAVSQSVREKIKGAKSYEDIAEVFAEVFFMSSVPVIETGSASYKDEKSDFGLKTKGVKTREKINTKAKAILRKADSLDELSQENLDFLKQYSGRGGLTENSQFEYYTPTPIAEGVWDILKMHGFENGNVLDPCTGAGVFPTTKPKGVLVTGADIDPVGSKIAQMFNPEDSINNSSFEALVAKTEDSSFDSVVGNVPFGDARGKSIHEDPAYKTEKRIERYFLLRIMDKLKPGGLACLVVPINIVGAKNDKWKRFRIAMSKKGEFLGAHKLPSKAFRVQGTDTVVDIVVFKKHPQDLLDKVDDIDFETLKESNVIWDEFITGQYWAGEGKRFIQGKYIPKTVGDRWSRETVDGDIDAMAIKKKLAQHFDSRIDWDALESASVAVKNYVDGDQKIINGIQYEMVDGEWQRVHLVEKDDIGIDEGKYGAKNIEDLKVVLASPEGGLGLKSKQLFSVYKAWPDMLSPLQKDAVEFSMSQPDDSFHEQACRGTIIGGLLGRLKANPDENERTRLQELVVSEIDKYGHPKNNSKLCLTGSSSRQFGLFMNSVDEKGQFSDLLAGTLVADRSEFDSTNIQSIVEHLFVREGIHAIELEDVKKLYAGTMKLDSLGDLAQVDNIAITADGMVMPFGRYTAGDIYANVQAMTDAMADEEDSRLKAKWQQQIGAINKKRKVTATEDITVGLQDKWLSKKYLVDFLRENGYPGLKYGYYEDVDYEDPLDGEMSTRKRFVEDQDSIGGEFIGIKGSGFPKQFLKYLNGGKITSSKAEYAEQYKSEAAAVTENFNAWMQQHEDMDQVAASYNRKFNAFLPHEYEDTDLHLEGFAKQVKLHGYQNSAIRRLSEEGRGILGDDVGLGKTYQAIALAKYNKQMGRSKKTCIVVPDAVLANWYHEVNFLTGNMKDALFVGFEPKRDKTGSIVREAVKDENGQPKINKFTDETEQQDVLIKRKSKKDIWEKMWEIPTSSKSLVIMTKEKFGSIPMRPETKGKYTSKMVERSLISGKMEESLLKDGGKKKSYQDDKDKANLEAKYADEGTSKKEELPYFEDMGFTDVIIDEAHEYKNSYQPGDTKGIAYLPTAPSSKRAMDMTLKTSYLKDVNNGRGVYPLTATPVTNSVFEIYNMLSYVCPVEEFERFGVYTVDDFIKAFGKIEQVDKVMVSGEVKPRDGLVGFRNLDGLRNLFHKYCILRNADDVGLELPPHEEVNDEVALSGEQMDIYNVLRDEAKDAAKPGSKISMFSVIRNMDRITTDADLYNHKMTFHFRPEDETKVRNLVVDLPSMMTVIEKDEDGRSFKTQVEVTHEASKENGAFVLVVPEQVETAVVTRLARFGIDEADVSHPLTPKYAKMVENLRLHLEANGKQIVFTEEKSQHQKIKRILAHHVPLSRDKIGIINAEEAEGSKLQQISDSYNSGKIKIVIANKKAEVGVNLQKGTTAIHHLTLPWTPASIQQRNGRGVRQGNKAANIKIYYYLGGKSFDYYRLDLLKRKSNWMRDLFNGDATESENANALSQDDMLDLLADNPEEAKRRRMERLAKQKEEREERERRRLINMMQQAGNISETLASYDEKREERRKKIESDVNEHERVIADLREKGLKFEEGDERRKKIGARISKRKKQLAESKKVLSGLDAAFAAKKVSLEAKTKQLRGVLNLKAKKGELPFDAKLIDHPEDMVATLDGRVLVVGETYDDTGHPTNIYKITKVFNNPKAVQVEAVIGNIYSLKLAYIEGTYDRVVLLSHWNFKSLVKCSYSEKELALKKLLSERMEYPDLIKIDKAAVLENLDKIKLVGDALVRTPEGYKFEYASSIKDCSTIVYPEPDNIDFRKALAETYFSNLRERGYTSGSVEAVMTRVFGSDWENVAAEYGKTATEMEIRSFYGDYIQNHLDQNLENGANETDPRKALKLLLNHYSFKGQMQGAANKALGDNATFIGKILFGCLSAQVDDLKQKVQQIEKEEKEAELKAIKEHPDYKEVPDRIKEAFGQMGITVKTNITQAVLPGRGRRGDTSVEPFSKWFLQDKHGKAGVLFRVKDILKARYNAKFFSSYSGDFQGAWWHVESKEDLEDIYDLMS